MRFWEDMQSKWGFSDGDSVPDGVEVYRTLYIRVVNKLGEQRGSTVRAVAYDRNGVHNWCLIFFYQLADLKARTPKSLTKHTDLEADGAEADEAMAEAIQQAYLLGLDSFIQVSVEVIEGFEAFFAALHPMNEGDPIVVEVNGQMQKIQPGMRVHLIQAVKAFDGSLLEAGSEFTVAWIDHFPPMVGLSLQPGHVPIAMTIATSVLVIEPLPSASGENTGYDIAR